MTKSRSRNQPFVADWRDPSNYPSIRGTASAQWAWELLRRSRQYARDFDKLSDVFKRITKRLEDVHAIPSFVPDYLPESSSLAPWRCYPIASPYKQTLAEYKAVHGRAPKVGIRRDLYVARYWALNTIVPPETRFITDLHSFKVRPHHPASPQLSNSSSLRNLNSH